MKKVLSFLIAMGMVFGMTTAVNAAVEKTGTLTDSCADFGKVYEKEGMLSESQTLTYKDKSGNPYSATAFGMAKETKSGYVTYEIDGDISSVDIRVTAAMFVEYVTDIPGNYSFIYKIKVSPDNIYYTDLGLELKWGNQFGFNDLTDDGRVNGRLSSDDIPMGMKYLKIEFPTLVDKGANQSDYSRSVYSVNVEYTKKGYMMFNDNCSSLNKVKESSGLLPEIHNLNADVLQSGMYGMSGTNRNSAYVIYELGGNISSVTVNGVIYMIGEYDVPDAECAYQVMVSPDGVNYTDLNLRWKWLTSGYIIDKSVNREFIPVEYSSNNIPAGMKYLKIVLPPLKEDSSYQYDYSRGIYNVKAEYYKNGYGCIDDYCKDFSKLYDRNGLLDAVTSFTYKDKAGNTYSTNAFGMERTVVDGGYVTYHTDGNITAVDVRGTGMMFAEYEEMYKIMVSPDDENYTDLGLEMQWGNQFGFEDLTDNGCVNLRYASDNIPAGMKYLKIVFPTMKNDSPEYNNDYTRSIYRVSIDYEIPASVDVPSYNFTDGENGKTTLAASVNAVGKDSEISVFAATYDENGKLVDCAMQKKSVSADTTEDFEITVTKSAKTLGFVWSGAAPEAEILK